MRSHFLRCIALAPLTLSLAACAAGPRGTTTVASRCGSDVACQQRLLLKQLVLPEATLGPNFVKATYSVTNPACWTLQSAPGKMGKSLKRMVAAGAPRSTRFCYVEYVRRGTHDDIIIKVFLLPSAAAARRAVQQPYVRYMNTRLTKVRLPPIDRMGNVVFWVVGSESNLQTIRSAHPRLRKRLGRP